MKKNKLKILSVLVILSVLLIILFLVGQIDGNHLERTGISELNLVEVSPSVTMVHNDKLQGSNIVCVALDDGLVFIDCSFFTEIGQAFRKAMEEKYNRKTLALIQSHVHIDHFFGMGAFCDVPLISSVKAKPNFKKQLAIDFEKYKDMYDQYFPNFSKALESASFREPNVWFDGELTLGSGDSKLVLRDAGGHSGCSIYAYFEKEKVILAGDIVQVDYHLYFGEVDGSISEWVNTLKVWEEMEVDHICAGHGPVADKNYATITRDFLERMLAKFYELKENGASKEDLVAEVNALENYWSDDLPKPGWYDPAIERAYKVMTLEN